jgi:antitoxin component HigA of HigAB toxin-antitoxin module
MTADKTKSPAATLPVDMASIWAESMADSDFSFDIKAQTVSTDLVRAISECGYSQADVAQKLGWSASRVSRVLHGAPNLTLRTLHELSSALNLEFDIIYRKAGENRAPQPWEAIVMQAY